MRSEGVCAREKGWRWSVQRVESKESREREQKASRVLENGLLSVNRFPQFTKQFSD